MAVKFNDAVLKNKVRVAAFKGVVKSTEALREEALRLILDTPKSGRLYRRGNVIHQASAPGEAPASDTGTLVNRMETKFNEDDVSGKLVANTNYAASLEFGTFKMEPRPFMRPAVANMRDVILGFFQNAIRSVK